MRSVNKIASSLAFYSFPFSLIAWHESLLASLVLFSCPLDTAFIHMYSRSRSSHCRRIYIMY